MKRNRKKKSNPPVWHDQEMGTIVELMEGWELLKHGLAKIPTLPAEQAALQTWLNGLAPACRMYVGWLDSIVPAARAEIVAWLNPGISFAAVATKEAIVPTGSNGAPKVFLVIVRLWERYLAAGELAGHEDQLRWLSERSREEQLLLTRLSKRITLPES